MGLLGLKSADRHLRPRISVSGSTYDYPATPKRRVIGVNTRQLELGRFWRTDGSAVGEHIYVARRDHGRACLRDAGSAFQPVHEKTRKPGLR